VEPGASLMELLDTALSNTDRTLVAIYEN
jgi:hypothetical protein